MPDLVPIALGDDIPEVGPAGIAGTAGRAAAQARAAGWPARVETTGGAAERGSEDEKNCDQQPPREGHRNLRGADASVPDRCTSGPTVVKRRSTGPKLSTRPSSGRYLKSRTRLFALRLTLRCRSRKGPQRSGADARPDPRTRQHRAPSLEHARRDAGLGRQAGAGDRRGADNTDDLARLWHATI